MPSAVDCRAFFNSQNRRPDICSTPSSCSILAFPKPNGKKHKHKFYFRSPMVRRCSSMSHCFWPFVVPSTFFFFFYLCLTRIQIAFQCLGWKGGRFNPMEKASCSAGRPNYSTLGTTNETYASALDKTFGIFWPARFHEAISVLGSFMLQRKIHR